MLELPVLRAAVVAATVAAVLVSASSAALSPVPPPAALPLSPHVPSPRAAPAPVATAPVRVAPVAPVAPAVEAAPVGAPTVAETSAVGRALGKVGAPYRWGAAGPTAFDCSGLVTWAYRGSEVSLPRSSRAMSTVGTRVARADLRPGDLVFFYRPVSHVGIYVGDGRIVHASSRRSPVKVSSMAGMPFTVARRV